MRSCKQVGHTAFVCFSGARTNWSVSERVSLIFRLRKQKERKHVTC